MINDIVGIFLILHGLVHLLYVALTQNWIIDSDIVWNEESKLLSRFISDSELSILGLIAYAIAIISIIVSGAGLMIGAGWWKYLLTISAIYSSTMFLLFWDGQLRHLPDKGFIGIAINIGLIIFVIVY